MLSVLLCVILCWCLPAFGAQQVLFENDFSAGSENWPAVEQASGWRIEGGCLVKADARTGGALVLGDETWRDYIMEFRLMRTEVVEGGHNGVHIRTGKDKRCHIFLRPDGLRYEMPPVTETDFTVRPLRFETGRWYRFRMIVHGSQVDVEVDDVYQGSVYGLHNRTGGIRFVAYNVALKLDDVRVTSLAAEREAVAEERPVAPLEPEELSEGVRVHVISTCPVERRNWPVTCPVDQLGLPDEANVSSLTAFDAAGRQLPSQVDDTDLSGGPSDGDELCFGVTLPGASVTTVSIKFDRSRVDYQRQAESVVSVQAGEISGSDYAVTWEAETEGDKELVDAARYHPGDTRGGTFFAMRPWEGEETVSLHSGPVRAVWACRAPLEADGVLSRRIECYGGFMRMVARLGPREGLPRAGIRAPYWGGVGAPSFHWSTPMLGDVEAMRWRQFDGYGENLEGNFDQLWFPDGGGAPHLQFDLGDRALAIFVEVANDYDGGAFLVGRHEYYAGHLHFGWRSPIITWADEPSITKVTVVRTDGGREAFERAEDIFASGPVVVSDSKVEQWVETQAELVGTLKDAARAADYGEAARRLTEPARTLREAVHARVALLDVDVSGLVERLDGRRKEQLARLRSEAGETTAARAFVRRMQPPLAAARWDWNVGRYDRAIERVGWALELREKAGEAARNAPSRELRPSVEAGPITPYVTITGQAKQAMAEFGLTVSHDWLPWSGRLREPVENSSGEYDWERVDELIQAVNETGMSTIPLINFNPPGWFKERYDDFGHHELVDPKLLGEEPAALKHFGRWIDAASKRFEGAESILAWSVRNEPAYLPGGAAKSPLMLEAMREWLRRKYGRIERMNEIWGTDYGGFDEVQSPERRSQMPAACYDMVMFKAEAIAGELGWEADIIQGNSGVERTGAKYVPAIIGTGGVRAGMGPDPWTGAAPQRGVAMCDLYTDSDWQTYRLASELWYGAGGSPVVSVETGLKSRPRQRRHRWVRYPPERHRSFAWSALQFGMYGTQMWSWTTKEEYSYLNWDQTATDAAIWIGMANQERLAAANLLSTLKPVSHIGYYYPQASFIDAPRGDDVPGKYAELFRTLTALGYQLRNFSFRDIEVALGEVDTVILPPAPYVEGEVVPKLREFVGGGGKLLAIGEPAIYDEHLRPLNDGASALSDVFANAGEGGVGLGRYGEGRVALITQPLRLPFGRGTPIADLHRKWRFRFGLSWPQDGMNRTEPPKGAVDRGQEEGWERPDYDDSDWDVIRVPGVWEKRGYPGRDGYGWYRLTLPMPTDIEGKRIVLSADTLDDRAWVYVNGHLVRRTGAWDERFEEDISQYVRPGERNVIALRILDNCFEGGVRGRLGLTCPDIRSEGIRLVDETLRALGARPEAACETNGIVRRIMEDSTGERHLLYTNETGGGLATAIALPFALPRASGALMNLLNGRRLRYEIRGGDTVVQLEAEPHEIGIVPLRSVAE